jgi:hypothetical protein
VEKPIYREFTGKEYHDYYESVGIAPDKKTGDSSIGYSKNFNRGIRHYWRNTIHL